MRLLVTGGAGYIGSITTELLLEQGHNVVVVDNLKAGHKEAVPRGAIFYQGDLGDTGLLEKIFSAHPIEAVLHFAGETLVELSMKEPARFFSTNVVKGLVLLNEMLKHRCNKLIFSSTAAIFGEPRYTPIDEDHPQRPVNAYGESKLMFERALQWYHRAYGLRFIALRYFNAAGASSLLGEDHRPETHLIPIVLQVTMGKRDHVDIFGTDYPTKDGTCIRDYIHVVDLARAHTLALERLDHLPSGAYNLGNGQGFSVLDVIKTAERVTGRPIPYREAPRRPGDPAVLIASSDRARVELDWRPQVGDLDEIIRSAWLWHRSHPHGYGDSEAP